MATDSGSLQVELSSLPASDWNAIVGRFDDACVEQTFEYAAARTDARRLQHLVVRRADTVIAATQLVIVQIPLLGTGAAFVKFGPMWRTGDADGLQAACIALRDKLVREQNLLLRLMPPASPDMPEELPATLGRLGFICNPIADATRYLVDLAVDETDRLSGLKPKWRYNLKRAAQRGMTVARHESADAVARFAHLYAGVRRRKGFSDGPDPDDLPALLAGMPATIRPALVLCTQHDKLVAGAVVATLGDTAVYLFGASSGDALPLGAGYLLHWEICRWLATTRCRWYDLGGDCGDQGLRQFKSGLVGRTGALPTLPGYYDLHATRRARMVGAGLFSLRDALDALRQRR